jgi:hypothetical protein
MTVDEESKLYADTLCWMAQAGGTEWPPCAPPNWTRLNASSGPLDLTLLNAVDFVMLGGVKWHELKNAHDEWKKCYWRSMFAGLVDISAFLAGLAWARAVHGALAFALILAFVLWFQACSNRHCLGKAKRITRALKELLKTVRPDLAKQERW